MKTMMTTLRGRMRTHGMRPPSSHWMWMGSEEGRTMKGTSWLNMYRLLEVLNAVKAALKTAHAAGTLPRASTSAMPALKPTQ